MCEEFTSYVIFALKNGTVQAGLESDNGSLQFHALTVLHEWSPSIWKQPLILEVIETIAFSIND